MLGGGPVDVTGRLIGGCLETVGPLAATPYGDVAAFGREHADEGIVVYLEACEDGAYTIARTLHSLRYAGWFEHATAGADRSHGRPGRPNLTQAERSPTHSVGSASRSSSTSSAATSRRTCPLVNGALAHVVVDGDRREITQALA